MQDTASAVGDCLKRAYTYTVPARHRALLSVWAKGRCDRNSRCARQAAQLVKILSTLQQRLQEEEEKQQQQQQKCNLELKQLLLLQRSTGRESGAGMKRKGVHGSSRMRSPPLSSLQQQPPLPPFSLQDEGGEKGGLCVGAEEECIAILDEPDRFLTMRRTTALAMATLQEALAQAQQDSMPHEYERMAAVVQGLERLERLIAVRFDGCRVGRGTETQERALLTHMGRGVELAALISKKSGATATASATAALWP